jgi:branched-chain amino acid aminotransferase
MKIFLDGEFLDRDQARVSVFDHGLLYGDGIFEGIRVYNGRVFRLEEHLERLVDSAKAILLKLPMSIDAIREATLECCRLNEVRDGYIRLVVTRGVGDLGLAHTKCPKATVFIIAGTISLYPEECYTKGLKAITAPTRRTAPAALSPSVKSLNYLNNVMAKAEGMLAGASEVVMLNEQGYVAEGSGDNIFVVKKGRLYTPPVYAGSLNGITRAAVVDLATEAGLPLTEVQLTRYDLFVADEFFMTGTGAEIVPVVELDGRVIGDGTPGTVTRDLMARYHRLTATTGTPIF